MGLSTPCTSSTQSMPNRGAVPSDFQPQPCWGSRTALTQTCQYPTNTTNPVQDLALSKQEAQLMLTNPHDAFRGQSRSPNIIPFHMLGIVSSFAIAILSLRCAIFPISNFKRCHDLEIRVRGHSRSLKVVPFDRLYNFLLVFYRNFVHIWDIRLQKCRDLEGRGP